MEVLQEGQLHDETDMNRVMEHLLAHRDKHSIVRITSDPIAVNGKIAVASGGMIVGARESGGDTRYNALRKLLGVRTGTYAVLEAEPEEFEKMNQKVYIKIERVLPVLTKISTISDGIFEKWSVADGPSEQEIADVQRSSMKMHALTPKRSKRFNRFLVWERWSERFLGVFFWGLFLAMAIGLGYYWYTHYYKP